MEYRPKRCTRRKEGTGLNTAHIHIRKTLLFLAVAMLVLVCTMSALALTDASSIGFELNIDPSTLKAPGPVTAKVTITNKGTQDITVPMTLYDADDKIVTSAFDGGVLAQLKAGESRSWEGQWNVSQKHLDAGKVSFSLRLNTTDTSGAIAQVSIPAAVPVLFQGEKVELAVSRTISPEIVRPNSIVTVTYDLVNNGTVKLTNISIKENSMISTKAQTVKTLEPGASYTLKFEKNVANVGVESSAVVTYYRDGAKTQLRQTVEVVQIPVAKPGFSAELTVDKDSVIIGEKVILTLTMKNEGNIDYTGIKVVDARLGEVFTNLSLPAGQTLVQTKEITMMVPTAFRFNISLTDNTGVTQSVTTDEVKISAYKEGQIMRLNAQLTADRENVDDLPGFVRMSIKVTNDSNTPAKPVNLYHGSERIASIDVLAPGQSTVITREFNISQAGKFRFEVRTVDSLNNTVSFDSNEISIGLASVTASPTKLVPVTIAPVVTFSPIPAAGDDSVLAKGKNALFILVWVLGLLFAGGLVLFLISSFMRTRAKIQSDAAYDHLQLEPKRDFADPSTYQETNDSAANSSETLEAADKDLPKTGILEDIELPHHKYLAEDAPKKPIAENLEESDSTADAAPLTPSTEEGAYKLVRDDDTAVQPAAPATHSPRRRAAKHKNLPEDDE